jgi:hypothetical protein
MRNIWKKSKCPITKPKVYIQFWKNKNKIQMDFSFISLSIKMTSFWFFMYFSIRTLCEIQLFNVVKKKKTHESFMLYYAVPYFFYVGFSSVWYQKLKKNSLFHFSTQFSFFIRLWGKIYIFIGYRTE